MSKRLTKDHLITILAWGLAYTHAQDNAQALYEGVMTRNEASAREEQLQAAEDELFRIPEECGPAPLSRWRSAHKPSREWFDAREALLEWIEEGFSGVTALSEGKS